MYISGSASNITSTAMLACILGHRVMLRAVFRAHVHRRPIDRLLASIFPSAVVRQKAAVFFVHGKLDCRRDFLK